MPYLTKDRPINTFVERASVVGPVGDTNTQPRLQQSTPDYPMRWDPAYFDNLTLGANIQDGDSRGFTSGGWFPTVTEDSPWNRSHIGHQKQVWNCGDFVNNDNSNHPEFEALPFSDYRYRIARMYDAKTTGQMFLPLPGQFQLAPGEVPRGGLAMQITGIAAGDLNPLTNGTPQVLQPMGGIQNVTFDHQDLPSIPGGLSGVGYMSQGMRGPMAHRNHGMPGK